MTNPKSIFLRVRGVEVEAPDAATALLLLDGLRKGPLSPEEKAALAHPAAPFVPPLPPGSGVTPANVQEDLYDKYVEPPTAAERAMAQTVCALDPETRGKLYLRLASRLSQVPPSALTPGQVRALENRKVDARWGGNRPKTEIEMLVEFLAHPPAAVADLLTELPSPPNDSPGPVVVGYPFGQPEKEAEWEAEHARMQEAASAGKAPRVPDPPAEPPPPVETAPSRPAREVNFEPPGAKLPSRYKPVPGLAVQLPLGGSVSAPGDVFGDEEAPRSPPATPLPTRARVQRRIAVLVGGAGSEGLAFEDLSKKLYGGYKLSDREAVRQAIRMGERAGMLAVRWNEERVTLIGSAEAWTQPAPVKSLPSRQTGFGPKDVNDAVLRLLTGVPPRTVQEVLSGWADFAKADPQDSSGVYRAFLPTEGQVRAALYRLQDLGEVIRSSDARGVATYQKIESSSETGHGG